MKRDNAPEGDTPASRTFIEWPELAAIKDRNRELNLLEIHRGNTALQSLPRYVALELTQGCNLYCEMCRNQPIGIRSAQMDGVLFQRAAEQLLPTAEVVDLRGWGESLLLPDIADTIRYCTGFGCQIRFVTNLSFHRPHVLECLAENHCHLAVSLDSADPAVLPRLRRGASLKRIASNLKILAEKYTSRHGTAKRIVLNCTVQRPALPTLASLIELASEVGVQEVRLARVSTSESSPLSLAACDKEVSDALGATQIAAREHGVRVFASTRFAGFPDNPQDMPACIHPWAYAFVDMNGLVGFCDHLIGPANRKYLIGDLQCSSFAEIWNSDEWQQLRAEHLGARRSAAPLFEHCAWCYRNRYVEFEDLLVPELASAKVCLA